MHTDFPTRTIGFVVRELNIGYLLYFLLTPARPTKPVPRRSMVDGSGTGFGGSGEVYWY